ncbi:hypothetical protein BpHYR1_044648 [Brachionus plicatilis]|uniref:Uncharacterized protein n=1 Tax=Brachionus plicatilis TaxID=10195 RepID=A0A3M7T6T4_BRAPC|nr:hypothetical protein BpHYR1_044648 [Brachionus plicatilis]
MLQNQLITYNTSQIGSTMISVPSQGKLEALTAKSKLVFSLNAPTHPLKPITNTNEPTTRNIKAGSNTITDRITLDPNKRYFTNGLISDVSLCRLYRILRPREALPLVVAACLGIDLTWSNKTFNSQLLKIKNLLLSNKIII